jgi:hypothetical protein
MALGSVIEKGQMHSPMSLLPAAPSEGDDTLEESGDLDQIGSVWERNVNASFAWAPVITRPVTVAVIS